MTVETADGVRLHVESVGPDDAPVTVLLVHGWTCSSRSWHNQIRDLPAILGDRVRVVAYDHRGHGQSDPAPHGTARVEQLVEDLVTVLETVVPTGPVVYAGHSMGGITLMGLAEARPEVVEDRIAAAVLVSTSAGRMGSRAFGLPARFDPVSARVAPRAMALAARRADRRAARAGRRTTVAQVPRLQRPALRRVVFGKYPDPAELDVFFSDLGGLPGYSLSGFFETLMEHDRADALKVLSGVPVEVMHGTRDRLLGPGHANRIAQQLPHARLWMYPGAGHMLMQERPRDVTQRLANLVRKVT